MAGRGSWVSYGGSGGGSRVATSRGTQVRTWKEGDKSMGARVYRTHADLIHEQRVHALTEHTLTSRTHPPSTRANDIVE